MSEKKIYILEFSEEDYDYDFYVYINFKNVRRLNEGKTVEENRALIYDSKIEEYEEQLFSANPFLFQLILKCEDREIIVRLASDYQRAILKEHPNAKLVRQKTPIIKRILEKRLSGIVPLTLERSS
jgi:hypothetical protein